MKKKSKAIDPAYYEKTCFAADFIEAQKNGSLIIPKEGETTLDAIKRYREARKKTLVAMRLPVYVINEAKAQAKRAGVPYTSYIQAILETAMSKPQLQPTARAVK